jgi:hypothetical protein
MLATFSWPRARNRRRSNGKKNHCQSVSDLFSGRPRKAGKQIPTDDSKTIDENNHPRVFVRGYPVLSANKIYVIDYPGMQLDPLAGDPDIRLCAVANADGHRARRGHWKVEAEPSRRCW